MGALVVGSHGLLNPVHEVADPGVDARPVLLGAAVAPGDDSLELSVADHGATRVTLGRKKAGHILQRRGKTGAQPTALGVQIQLPGRPRGWGGVSAWEGANHLAGILATLQEAGAHHVAGDLSGVRGFALGLGQQGSVQALQQLRVVD